MILEGFPCLWISKINSVSALSKSLKQNSRECPTLGTLGWHRVTVPHLYNTEEIGRLGAVSPLISPIPPDAGERKEIKGLPNISQVKLWVTPILFNFSYSLLHRAQNTGGEIRTPKSRIRWHPSKNVSALRKGIIDNGTWEHPSETKVHFPNPVRIIRS